MSKLIGYNNFLNTHHYVDEYILKSPEPNSPKDIDFINKNKINFADDIEAEKEYNIVKPNLVDCFNNNIKYSSEFRCPLYNFFDVVNKKPGMKNKIKTLFQNDLINKGYDFDINEYNNFFNIKINS